MFFKKKTKQALSVIMCLALVMSAFINFPVKAKAAEVGKTVIDSIEIDTNLFGIQQMCGPAYLISEVKSYADDVTGPKKEEYKGYHVETEIYYRIRREMKVGEYISFVNCSKSNSLMSNETLKSWETGGNAHVTAFYIVFHVVADNGAGYYFDPKNKPTFSFKGYGGTGNFKYVDWNSYVACNEKEMCIGTEISLNTNQKPRVARVKIQTPSHNDLGAGQTMQLNAKVDAYKLGDGVNWSITNQRSQNTTIDENGLLTVGLDEPLSYVFVTATSKEDPTKKDSITILAYPKPDISAVEIDMGAELTSDGSLIYECYMDPGTEKTFRTNILGTLPGHTEEDVIFWDDFTVEPGFFGLVWLPQSDKTGVFPAYNHNRRCVEIHIGIDEPVGVLVYTVRSGYDPSKYALLRINVGKACDIKYDANGGSFVKSPNKTILEGGTIWLADSRDVIPPAGKVFRCWNIAGVEYKSGAKIDTVNRDLLVRAIYIDEPFVTQPNSVSFACDNKTATAADKMINFQFNYDGPGEIEEAVLQYDKTKPAGYYELTGITEVDLKPLITVAANKPLSVEAKGDWIGACRIRFKVDGVDYYSSVFRVDASGHVHDKWTRSDNLHCSSVCSMCGADSLYQLHVWGNDEIVKYPTATESGVLRSTCIYCGTQQTNYFDGYFTVQPQNIYNKNHLPEDNSFSVSEVMKAWSIERMDDGEWVCEAEHNPDEYIVANTLVEFSCGKSGDIWPGEYRIKAELESGCSIYSEPFVIADAIESVEVWDLDKPIAGETLDYDVAINTNPIYEDAIEKTTIRWYKTDSRFPIALSTAAKAINGQSYYCEIILTPAEGYAFEPTEFRNYAGELFCYDFSSAKVADDGKLHIVFRPVEAEPRIDRITKDNLVIVPNPIVVGSRLVVNEDVINNADEDIVDGYLNGNVTWVYTSMWGIVSKFRYDNDYEYFTVTSDMRGGSVRCEVYAETGNVAWVSPEISLENVENEAININGASLTMEGQIGVNFFLTIPDVDMDLEGAYIYMSYTGDTTKPMKVLLKDGIATDNGYKFTFPVAVKELCDKVSLQAYTANGDVIPLTRGSKKKPVDDNIFKYAVIDYLNDVPVYNSTDTNLVAFAESLVNYGAEAQNYFKHNAGTLTSTADYSKVTSATLQPYDATKSGTAIAGLKVRGVSLTLESELIMNVAFASTDDVINKVTFKVNGKEVKPVKQPDGMYKIEVPNIAAKDLDEFYTVEYTDGTNTQVVKCCPLGYAYTVLQGSDEGLKTLVKAMYLYNQAANLYFEK